MTNESVDENRTAVHDARAQVTRLVAYCVNGQLFSDECGLGARGDNVAVFHPTNFDISQHAKQAVCFRDLKSSVSPPCAHRSVRIATAMPVRNHASEWPVLVVIVNVADEWTIQQCVGRVRPILV
jgi:hypothetical protein